MNDALDPDTSAILEGLRRAGEKVAKSLRSRDVGIALPRGGSAGGNAAILLAPAFAAGLILFAAPPEATIALPVMLAIALPLVGGLFAIVRVCARPLDVASGLRRLDVELGLKGRLAAAFEFAQAKTRTSFMAAAILDAAPFVALANEHRILRDATPSVPPRALFTPLIGAALALLVVWLAPPRARHEIRIDAPDALSNAPELVARTTFVETKPEIPPADPRVDTPPPVDTTKSTAKERAGAMDSTQQAHESRGKSGGGRSTAAAPTGSSSESQGFESAASPPSDKAEPEKSSTAPKKPKKPRKEGPTPEKKVSEQSGSTAGRGTGTGSSKNPGSTDWASKDQVTSEDEDPLEDEPDVDDETDEQEARGGLQPNLRDRRPAVNRDLTIGFAVPDQPNPDANGRSSGGDTKKSRGVAALVLGVPIPDHVKGQPNPGRTKITQERVEPKPDAAEPIDAESAAARVNPVGPTSSRDLTDAPWLRELVRKYFERPRTKSRGSQDPQ